jgi:hypothetical protein
MTTTQNPRTSRSADGAFASMGAVRQNGGKLPIYVCNTCHHEVCWATSTRTGRKYLVNVRRGNLDQRYYIGSDIHRCEEAMAVVNAIREEQAKHDAGQAVLGAMRSMRAKLTHGEITEDEYMTWLDAQ